jgi:hypothetical protein
MNISQCGIEDGLWDRFVLLGSKTGEKGVGAECSADKFSERDYCWDRVNLCSSSESYAAKILHTSKNNGSNLYRYLGKR